MSFSPINGLNVLLPPSFILAWLQPPTHPSLIFFTVCTKIITNSPLQSPNWATKSFNFSIVVIGMLLTSIYGWHVTTSSSPSSSILLSFSTPFHDWFVVCGSSQHINVYALESCTSESMNLYDFNLLILTNIRFGSKLVSITSNTMLLSNTYCTL